MRVFIGTGKQLLLLSLFMAIFGAADTYAAVATPKNNEKIIIVKPGDTLEKLLMRECSLNFKEATEHIEKVRKRNKMLNIRRLYAGQKMIIPPMICASPVTTAATPSAQLPRVDLKRILILSALWKNIVPPLNGTLKPLSFKSGNFSLSLDTGSYPVFYTMDGSRIIIDENRSIPIGYMQLIAEQEPTLQIIRESVGNGKHFLASLLHLGRFHSVEEDCKLEFGVDPKLTIHADFKVERTAESLFNNDVILFNAEKPLTSPAVSLFLKNKGFVLYEPFSTKHKPDMPKRNRLVEIIAKTQPEIVDGVVSALSLPIKREHSLDIAPKDGSGINLSIKIKRLVEHNGQRYAIICYEEPDLDAISAILVSNGIHVIAMKAEDNFRTVIEKILTSLKISGTYGFHQLLPVDIGANSLQVSGVLIKRSEQSGGLLFITDRKIDGINRDIAEENGYTFQ